jgi:putative membrane protein
MNIRAKDFFSKAEKEKIRRSVNSAEAQTSGEIAVMVVDESDGYREAEVFGVIALAGLFSTILSLLLDHTTTLAWMPTTDPHYTSIWFWIPVTLALLVPSWYLFRLFPPLKLALVSRKRAETAVTQRAILSFYKKGLHRTRHETGILVFISLLERRVRILGDRGIHAKIGQEFWNARAQELVKGIKENRPLETLLEVIERCGVELASHFPSGSDNPNEVADDVIC